MGTLDTLVSALCADYLRRSELIRAGNLSRRVETELRYLNAKIIDATSELARDFEVEGFIEEIGSSVGYAKSRFDHISESAYKKRKKEIKDNIAHRLYLTE
jgi:hypothetical protein